MTPITTTRQARKLSAMRKTYGAGSGRPPKLRPCPRCGATVSARALRLRCPHRGSAAPR